MRKIDSEFRRADHLLYVSLKYTKTADVIRNIIFRWQATIELCIDRLLMRAKRTKKIKKIPTAPLAKTALLLKTNKNPMVKKIVTLYLFFREMKDLPQARQHEFRKKVSIVVTKGKKEIIIDIPLLYEWNEEIKEFIKYVKEKV